MPHNLTVDFPANLFDPEERQHTPGRVRRFHQEWRRSNDVRFTTFTNPGYDEIVALAGIDFASLCSHHLLPFMGKAHVGYIPGKRICGLSKLARVVDAQTHRPQVQERATQDIAEFLVAKLDPRGVMVILEAEHTCISIRGVRKPGSIAVTSAIRGAFADPTRHAKEEFLELVRPYRLGP